MRIQNIRLLWLVVFLLSWANSFAELPELQNSKQLLLVLSPDWNSLHATLQRYERSSTKAAWHLVDKTPIPVVIGKNGMAWGVDWISLHPVPSSAKIKKEGDGRSPAGVYAVGTAFGFAADAHQTIPAMQWAYLPLTATSICVDDQSSTYYNQLIDSAIIPNWDSNTSGEHMLQVVPQYTWGSVINYNTKNVKGAGSCIFMHIWRDATHGTAGCVAMEEKNVIRLLSWFDPSKKPVIALFPLDIYRNTQKTLSLPSI